PLIFVCVLSLPSTHPLPSPLSFPTRRSSDLFPARDHVGGCILYGFVVRSDEGFGPFLLATIENDRYEALGFNFRRSGKRKIRFHVMQNSIVGRCANAQAQCRTREPQPSALCMPGRMASATPHCVFSPT